MEVVRAADWVDELQKQGPMKFAPRGKLGGCVLALGAETISDFESKLQGVDVALRCSGAAFLSKVVAKLFRYGRQDEVCYDACTYQEKGRLCGKKTCCEHVGGQTAPRYRVRVQVGDGQERKDLAWVDIWGDLVECLLKSPAREVSKWSLAEIEQAKTANIGQVFEWTLRAQYKDEKWCINVTGIQEAQGETAQALKDMAIGDILGAEQAARSEKRRKEEETRAVAWHEAKRLASDEQSRLRQVRVEIEEVAAHLTMRGLQTLAVAAYEFLEGRHSVDECEAFLSQCK